MVRPKKAPSKKQKGGSIDFKKIKRKVGRKLPPPKNSTNTEIKSKAIVLPEQSIASERAGLAVSNKGLTLRELLQQTSHHNAKTRKFALVGIKDLLLKNPSELKLHKLVIIEKLRERICDNDKVVRDTLFHLLQTVIFPASKEVVTGPIVSLMMAYVFNAMTHLTLDIRLMAFKFFDLIVTSHPSSFFVYAEKVIDNYKDILQNSQIYLQDRSKVKNAISGLVRCLSLLGSEKQKPTSYEQEAVAKKPLHAFPSEIPKEHSSIYSLTEKLEELVPTLVNCFHEFTPVIRAMPEIDAISFDCILSVLQCIKLAVCFLVAEMDQSHGYLGGPVSSMSKRDYSMKNTVNELKKLWEPFPISSTHQLTEKEDDRYFFLNIRITEIYLHFTKGISETEVLMEKFLEFLANSLHRQIYSNRQVNKMLQDKYLSTVVPLIPGVVAIVRGDWRFRLLKAFTSTFQGCKVESKLNLACVSAIEEMLLSQEMLSLDSSSKEMLGYQVAWLQKLPVSLLQLGYKNPTLSKVILKLMLRIGQCSLPASPLDVEYNSLQFPLSELYCTSDSEGKICYGPFLKLPQDCQELAICCLYYFSSLSSYLLESLAYCCLCCDSVPFIPLRIIAVLQSAYKAGRVQIADYIGFLVTIVARFKVYHDECIPTKEGHAKISNRDTFIAITGTIFSCLSEMGDNILVLKLMQKSIFDEMHLKPSLDNIHGMLRMFAVLDSRPSILSEDAINTLSHIISDYLIDAASSIPTISDEAVQPNSIQMFEYYVKPCLSLFHGIYRLTWCILRLLSASIVEYTSLSASHSGTMELELSTRVIPVTSILILMIKDKKIQQCLSSSKEDVQNILKNLFKLLSSNVICLTVEERHKIQHAFERLKAEALKTNWLDTTDMEDVQK